MVLVVIETGDGSHTFFDTDQNIYFRSLQGARSEADQVFVRASQIAQRGPLWRILELGLGTALNFLATAEARLQSDPQGRLEYTAVEAAPLDPDVFRSLGHERRLKYPFLVEMVTTAFEQLQNQTVASVEQGAICLRVYKSPWQECDLPDELQVDGIYHDPFGPGQNPESWSAACFAWSCRHLDPRHGRLVTYGAATRVRQAMVAAGLRIGTLPGPGTKREMTVAAHDPLALADTRLLASERYQTGPVTP